MKRRGFLKSLLGIGSLAAAPEVVKGVMITHKIGNVMLQPNPICQSKILPDWKKEGISLRYIRQYHPNIDKYTTRMDVLCLVGAEYIDNTSCKIVG